MAMTIYEGNYFSNEDQDNQNNPTQMEDQQQIAQVHSLLRLMKISNEFVAIKDSMEMSPLPGNNVEFQHDYNVELSSQVDEFSQGMKATDLLMSLSLSADTTKHKIEELAEKAMDEVTKMFVEGDPLWQHDLDKGMERLWSFVFSEMLSRATVLGSISPGTPETFDGALQLMSAEYHAPSPLLVTRQSCFARYCKELSSNTWAIVDISLESLIDNPLMNCKRRPSGCLIQGLPDGNTQVTWIEHTEAEIASVHPLFKSLVSSGIVFSAKQWVDTLSRQCQHLDMLIQYSLNTLIKEVSPFRVERLLRLAERMRRGFYGATSATEGNGYKPISIKGGDDILIKTLNSDDQSPALLTVTTSSWFPFSAKKVFSFLGNDKNRTKWDARKYSMSTVVKVQKTLFPLPKWWMIRDILSNKDPSQAEEDAGSIVTVSFQLLDKSSRAQNVPKRSIRKLYNLVNGALSSIRAALFEAPASVEGSLLLIKNH
ncbi:homeobox-leucine zipper protein PROTODERMAL FACTOR 2-like [Chenopodium quinoa]|uniref:homeobox-leucine zipper protein PROTODERMAL FACTOR 2-like n=1 Tax=Chenopodium quinoa TaxID=63459 RepID=UPI000B771B0F|nr:homeobox-leucine zipper protein PROTODERMAL FACTOR 2-like [Chenopodium quinoa]